MHYIEQKQEELQEKEETLSSRTVTYPDTPVEDSTDTEDEPYFEGGLADFSHEFVDPDERKP